MRIVVVPKARGNRVAISLLDQKLIKLKIAKGICHVEKWESMTSQILSKQGTLGSAYFGSLIWPRTKSYMVDNVCIFVYIYLLDT